MLIPISSIIGQQQAISALTTSLHRDKLGHAYLFKGPGGVGKKMLAHAFAAFLNCASPQGHEVCGHCPACKKFSSGNHPDLIVLEPEGAGIKISQIRALQQQISFPPLEAVTRLIIIADIHENLRRPEVANALLKTLEEPPAQTIFILSADESAAILPTIISRCQIIPLVPLPLVEIASKLQEEGIAPELAMTLAAISEGSLGLARTLHEKDLLALRRDIINHLSTLAEDTPGTVQQVFSMAAQAAALKENLDDMLNLLTSWLRDLVILQTTNRAQLYNHDLGDLLSLGCRCWSRSALTRKLAAISQARQQLLRNCNRTLVLEVLFFALLAEKW